MNGIIGKRSAAGVLGVVAMMVAVSGCDSAAASRSVPGNSVAASVPPDWYGDKPVLRTQVDAARGRLWALTAEGVELYDAATRRKLAQIALPDWTWVGMQFACPPDLAIGPRGEAVISSNVVPTLWRVDPVSLAASKHDLALEEDSGKDVGITALVFSAQQGAYLAVSAAHGSLWRIDPRLARAQKIPLSEPLPKSCTLAIAPREPDRRPIRAVSMCVRGEKGDWTVAFAPDQRFGYVRPGQCMI